MWIHRSSPISRNTFWTKSQATVEALWFLEGQLITYLVNWSVKTTIYWFPRLVFRSGPTTSIISRSMGAVVPRRPIGALRFLLRWLVLGAVIALAKVLFDSRALAWPLERRHLQSLMGASPLKVASQQAVMVLVQDGLSQGCEIDGWKWTSNRGISIRRQSPADPTLR